MTDTIVELDKELEVKPKKQTKRPRDVQILLFVCGCYNNDILFNAGRMQKIAQILRFSESSLVNYAKQAIKTGRPQIVGCYPPEIAETILIRLTEQTPFITPSCHRFFIQKM